MTKSSKQKIKEYQNMVAERNQEINKIDFKAMGIKVFNDTPTEEIEDLTKYEKKAAKKSTK